MNISIPTIKHVSNTRKFAYALYFLAGVLLSLTIVFAFSRDLDVLSNWKIIVPNQEIHAGDTVTIQSVYTKVRAVSGTATRYIECKNPQGDLVRYEINSKLADHAPGKGGTGIQITIPTAISNLPTRCRFSIVAIYNIYPGKRVTEFTASNYFTLLPKENADVLAAPQSTIQTSQPQPSGASRTQARGTSQSSSLSNDNANTNSSQPNNSQGGSDNPQQGIVTQVLQQAGNLVNSITRGVL